MPVEFSFDSIQGFLKDNKLCFLSLVFTTYIFFNLLINDRGRGENKRPRSVCYPGDSSIPHAQEFMTLLIIEPSIPHQLFGFDK